MVPGDGQKREHDWGGGAALGGLCKLLCQSGEAFCKLCSEICLLMAGTDTSSR